MLHSITYISKANIDPDKSAEELASLTRMAKRRNEMDNITGVLILENGVFYQTIEGPESKLMRLFESIKRDQRHEDIVLLISEPIEKQVFSDWSLDSFVIDDVQKVPSETMEALRKIRSNELEPEPTRHSAFVMNVVKELGNFRVGGLD